MVPHCQQPKDCVVAFIKAKSDPSEDVGSGSGSGSSSFIIDA